MANGNTIPIDWNKVDRLLECGNDGVRVAANLGISPETLYRRCQEEKGVGFNGYSAEKRQKGVSLLLAKQYEVAMKGNTTMLIWVGKQMADQKEQREDNTISEDQKKLNDNFNNYINEQRAEREAKKKQE